MPELLFVPKEAVRPDKQLNRERVPLPEKRVSALLNDLVWAMDA